MIYFMKMWHCCLGWRRTLIDLFVDEGVFDFVQKARGGTAHGGQVGGDAQLGVVAGVAEVRRRVGAVRRLARYATHGVDGGQADDHRVLFL